jgi:hypothetical protein
MRSGDYAAVMFSPEFPVDIGPKLLKKIPAILDPELYASLDIASEAVRLSE